jgi:cell wall-associated NlpC family hydrolase
MKLKRYTKALVFAGALLCASLAANNAEAATKYGDGILEKGSNGAVVTALQQDLRTLGYFTNSSNTGYFGEITEEAVKAFQKQHGLEQNGKVGQTTGPLIEAEAVSKAAEAPAKATGKAAVVETAKKQVGVPYAWGGTTPAGFDCSGFARYVYAQHGAQLPRTTGEMYNQGTAVKELQPGDLVFFSTYGPGATHVGIFVGDNKFISATSSYGVKIDSFSNSYWGPRYIGAKRL